MKIIFPLFSSVSWRNYWKHFHHYGIAILIFLVGLALSLAAFRFYQLQETNSIHTEFNRLGDLRIYLIKDVFLESLEQIEHIKQFYYASKEVTKKEFTIFTSGILNLYPNFLALGWLDANSSEISKPSLGFNFINLTQESTPYHFFPLTYLEFSSLHPHFHLDTADYTVFVNELQNSQTRLEITVSSNISYFEEEKKPGFFLFKPIFFEELNPNNHKMKLFGTIVGLSNFEDAVKKAKFHLKPAGINISLYDITKGSDDLLYWNPARISKDPIDLTAQERQLQKQWIQSHSFKFGNRIWKLQATPTLEFIHQHQNQRWDPWGIPMIGILISALMSSYFFVLVNRRIHIEQEVHNRVNELATINSILQQEIHQRQRIEEDFMAKQHYLERRHEALEYLTKLTASEPLNTIQALLVRTALVMQVDRVSVWFYETVDDTQFLSCTGIYTLPTNSFSNDLEISSAHFPHYFQALSKHTHLVLPSPQDAKLNQELSSYLAVFHINTKLDIPIIFEGKLLGVLSCEETRGYREWILEDRHFGQTMADIVALMIEQSARRKIESALKKSEERLRFITQNSIDGIISINNKEEIISWNFGAQQMFGYHEPEILGKSLRWVIPKDEFFLQEEVGTKPIELKGKHKDGHLFPVEISQTRWKSRETYFNTIIIRDITDRKEYENRLIKTMREAKAANAAKSEFLATISHELRTPLNAIIGFDQCLLMGMDGPINESQQESLEKIEKSSFHLLNLINDILDWSKIEAKKMELEIQPQNIVEIIISSVEEVQSLAYKKNLDIYASISKSFILVEVDRVRIKQVLLNLLSNAIKFTEKGFIKITVFDTLDQMIIEVADTGIGLSSEEAEKIFHPFSQADSSITRKYGGTGLGLIISKKIIDLHSGIITVESRKGQGSTFTITLPKFQ